MKDKIDDYISRVSGIKNKKLILLGFILLMVLLTRFGGKKEITKSTNHYENLGEMAIKISEIWKNGDHKELLEEGVFCEEEFGDLFGKLKSDLYFRCNPSFLNCYLRNFQKLQKSSIISFTELPVSKKPGKKLFYQLISRVNYTSEELPAFTIKVKAHVTEKSKRSIDIFLEDSCNDTYLPQRIYGAGIFNSNKIHLDWKWDNLNQQIFVDKNYVTYREINDWIDFDIFLNDSSLSNLIPENKNRLSEPATGLRVDQMKNYCHFRGKELLQSHILDAASFHPVSLQDIKREVIFRGPFPWAYEKKSDEIYKFWMDSGLDFKEEYCAKVFSKECLNQKEKELVYPIESSPTWIGIFNGIGSYAEYIDNKLKPKENVHPSSSLFNLRSRLHQVGVRAEWNMKKLDSSSFKIPEAEVAFDEMKLAFRCMKRL